MSRHQKVKPENRQRVAEACEHCKKTHQRCGLEHPCSRCVKKNIPCIKPSISQYEGSVSSDDASSELESSFDRPNADAMEDVEHSQANTRRTPLEPTSVPCRFRLYDAQSYESIPGVPEGADREYQIYIEPRMLGDRERPSYVGKESIWSFLQSIRLAVDGDEHGTEERKAFTQDEHRFRMDEPLSPHLPLNTTAPSALPKSTDCENLAEVFFTKTAGFVEVVDRGKFADLLAKPEEAAPFDLCLLYLVVSIGLMLSTPRSKSTTQSQMSAAQLYFATAKHYYDSGCQLSGATSQAVPLLILRAYYETLLSRWRTAYHISCAAVSLAHSFGLHQSSVETSTGQDLILKRNTWRSLVILQTALSIVTGLHIGVDITEELGSLTSPPDTYQQKMRMYVLEASYAASLTIDRIVQEIYRGESASVDTAIEFLGRFSQADDGRKGSGLDPRRIWPPDPSESISGMEQTSLTTLDVLQSLGVMLLTRPFLYNCVWDCRASREIDGRLRRLAEASVASSIRTLFALATDSGKILMIHNSVMLHACFTAAIIILSNEYFAIFDNPYFAWSMASVWRIFEQSDLSCVHTGRLRHIVEVFAKLVHSHRGSEQPEVVFQNSAQPKNEIQDGDAHRRRSWVDVRSAPPDSRASMSSHSGGGRTIQVPQFQQWGPPQPQQPVMYGSTRPQFQPPSGFSSLPHTPTYEFPPTTHQYPALEGIELQVPAGAPFSVPYSQESEHQPSQYWPQ